MSEANPRQPPGSGAPDPFAAPAVPDHELGGPQRPRAITAAFWIALVLPIVATLMSVGMVWLQQDEMRTSLGAVPPEERAVAQAAAMFAMVGAVLVYAVLTTLWIVFGCQLRAGRNWARVTLTVFAGIWATTLLLDVIATPAMQFLAPEMVQRGAAEALTFGQSAACLVGVLAFIILVYRPSSNEFFRANRRY